MQSGRSCRKAPPPPELQMPAGLLREARGPTGDESQAQTNRAGRRKLGVQARSAERVGFEPTRQFDPPTRFPVVHLKPLGHLSGAGPSLAWVRRLTGPSRVR